MGCLHKVRWPRIRRNALPQHDEHHQLHQGHRSDGAGFASYETLLYSPELKFYSNRVKMDADLNTNIRRLHCLGDSSGWTRGLMMASVMGVLMGREVIRQENI